MFVALVRMPSHLSYTGPDYPPILVSKGFLSPVCGSNKRWLGTARRVTYLVSHTCTGILTCCITCFECLKTWGTLLTPCMQILMLNCVYWHVRSPKSQAVVHSNDSASSVHLDVYQWWGHKSITVIFSDGVTRALRSSLLPLFKHSTLYNLCVLTVWSWNPSYKL